MSNELVFQLSNALVLPAWLLLLVAPRWKPSAALIGPILVPLLLAFIYVFLVVPRLGQIEGDFTSLAGIARLFQDRTTLLAGWIHYLAFDLFVGSWEVRDSRLIGLSHWLVGPCLGLTFIFGPAGLALYLMLRTVVRRRLVV